MSIEALQKHTGYQQELLYHRVHEFLLVEEFKDFEENHSELLFGFKLAILFSEKIVVKIYYYEMYCLQQ